MREMISIWTFNRKFQIIALHINIYFLKNRLYFSEQFQFLSIEWEVREFSHIPSPFHTCTASFTINMPHQSVTFAIIYLTHHCHSKSMIYVRVPSMDFDKNIFFNDFMEYYDMTHHE